MDQQGLYGDLDDRREYRCYHRPKQLHQLPFQPLLGHVISATRKDTQGKYEGLEEQIEKLQSENEEFKGIREEFEKIQQEKMTAEERAQLNAQKVIQEHEKKTKEATEKASVWEKLYKETVVRNEIMTSFGDSKLWNPEQVAVLFEKEGNARVEEKVDYAGKSTGQYETIVTLNIEDDKGIMELETGTPRELFPKWIKMDRNSHHLQNDLKPGGGTSQKVKLQSGEKIDLSEIEDPIERMNLAREHNIKK